MAMINGSGFTKDIESSMPGDTNIFDVIKGLVEVSPALVQAATGKEVKPFEVQFGVAGSAQRTALIGVAIVAVAVAVIFLRR